MSSRSPTYVASIGPYDLEPQVHMGRHRGHRRENLDDPPVVGRSTLRVDACSNSDLGAWHQFVFGHAGLILMRPAQAHGGPETCRRSSQTVSVMWPAAQVQAVNASSYEPGCPQSQYPT